MAPYDDAGIRAEIERLAGRGAVVVPVMLPHAFDLALGIGMIWRTNLAWTLEEQIDLFSPDHSFCRIWRLICRANTDWLNIPCSNVDAQT